VLVLAYTARPSWLPAGRGGGRAAGGGAAGKSGAAGRAVQPLCVLDAANGSGYTVHVKRLGGRCPSVWAYSVEARRGWRLRGVELAANGTARRLNASGYVELSGNATLRVEAERVRVTVRILPNASAPYLVNGSRRRGNATLEVPLGSTLVVEPLPLNRTGGGYVPLNTSGALVVEGNATLHLYWAWRWRPCRGGAVRIVPSVPGLEASIAVGGEERRLPLCLNPPVSIGPGIAGPVINATHRWWLAWYWVEENGSRHWWSPGINGSTLVVRGPANVTAVYVPGLKDLPYVERVWRWPEPYFNGSCPLNPGKAVEDIEVRDGWVHVYNPRTCVGERENKDIGRVFAFLEVSRLVGAVKLEVWVPDWRNARDAGIYVAIYDAGEDMDGKNHGVFTGARLDDPMNNFRPPVPVRTVIYTDTVYFCEAQPRRWIITMAGVGFNKYGFVKDWMHSFWRLPRGDRFLYVCVESIGTVARDVYIRVIAVSPP